MPADPAPLIPLPKPPQNRIVSPGGKLLHVPSDGTPVVSAPAPLPLWAWTTLGVLAAIGIVAIFYGVANRTAYERRCEAITIMSPCTGGDLFGPGWCRVETTSGARTTVSAPKMVGDVACWNEPVGE